MNKKKKLLNFLLDSVFIVVFNALFFLLGGTSHSLCAWIGYGFIHFAYAMVILTPILTRSSTSSHLFGVSLHSVSSLYFIVEFCIGSLFIIFDPKTINIALALQIVLAGFYAIILITVLMVNETTADKLEVTTFETSFIKDISARVQGLIGKLESKELNKSLERAYDELHSSPSKSCDQVSGIENDILNAIGKLERAVSDNDKIQVDRLAKKIVSLASDRTRKLKSLIK